MKGSSGECQTQTWQIVGPKSTVGSHPVAEVVDGRDPADGGVRAGAPHVVAVAVGGGGALGNAAKNLCNICAIFGTW